MLKKYLIDVFLNRYKKGEVKMKKRIAALVSAIVLMVTGAASMGCFWLLADEPESLKAFKD